ncbi:MAG: pilus assembly protein [Microcystis aeruginosa K13-05]|jgi:type IV pilus assembly protein PilN|uniref:PilN domain-containing protein n=1 Tax=unclassified Microcystis TaxID=2643300 RepID=UPI0022BF282F|nr:MULTISPECIES: PilN domain-containing protein [unclassified Microcystis]MCZ8049200.1 PilN domain-containing protein [Microcystis sp. LE19-41.2A]MCZ8290366.1 PilN domain-containing protein [Microcystis sp. LE19-59.1C]NCR80311.1 pilus assembly protein [Microcystis aeruginosa K13-10]NCR84937.1 pilus assembly protein [Microcystis aeruginosa K13-05]
MYSLDVNFLKDRHLSQTGKGTPAAKISTAINLRKQTPLLIGVGVGAGLLTLTGLLGLILGWQTSETQAKIQQLDAELGQLQAQSKKLEDMKAQLTAVGEENEALVTVFNQIRPWSAILQEIRQQTPPSVQLTSVQQVEVPAAPDQGQQNRATRLKISGFASNYEAVNDYLLTLQASPFLQGRQTVIESAALADLPVEVDNQYKNINITFPQAVQFVITAQLSDTPATEQLPNLARNGAIGVITRINTLKRQGAIQP